MSAIHATRRANAAIAAAERAAQEGRPDARVLGEVANTEERKAIREARIEARLAPFKLPADATDVDIIEARRKTSVQVGENVRATYFPSWSDIYFAMPLIICRGPLFSATELDMVSKERMLEEVTVAEDRAMVLKYTGRQMTQYVLEVYATCLDMLKDCSLDADHGMVHGNHTIRISFRQFIEKHLDRAYSINTQRKVRDSLRLLSQANLTLYRDEISIQVPRLLTVHFYEREYRVAGDPSIVASYGTRTHEEMTGADLIQFSVPVEMATLFRERQFGRIAKIGIRHKSELAAWMMWYLSGYSEPAWLSLDYLWRMSGSQATTRDNFRRLLDSAIKECQAPSAEGFRIVTVLKKRAKKNDPVPKIWLQLERHSPKDPYVGASEKFKSTSIPLRTNVDKLLASSSPANTHTGT